MPAGVQIFNDNNVLIIDENYKCLGLRIRYDLNAGSGWNLYAYNEIWYKDLTYYNEGPMPLVFVYVDSKGDANAGACIAGLYNNGGGGTWNIRVACCKTTDQNIKVFVFDQPNEIGGHDAGFKIWNSAGVMVFSTVFKPLIIKAFDINQSLYGSSWACSMFSSVGFKENEIEGVDSFGNPSFSYVSAAFIGVCWTSYNGGNAFQYDTASMPGPAPGPEFYSSYDNGGDPKAGLPPRMRLMVDVGQVMA